MARDTRQRLLETAGDLFYAHGFQAVGLDRVLSEVGITKTAFYKHFESKDALVVCVLHHRDGQDIAEMLEFMRIRGGSDPRARLLALFDLLGEWFATPEFRGCLFMSAATEFPSPADPIHIAASQHYANIERELVRLSASMGVNGAEALGRELMQLVQGAIVSRHVNGVTDSAATARRLAELLLENATGAALNGRARRTRR